MQTNLSNLVTQAHRTESVLARVVLIVVLAIAAHCLVRLVRSISNWLIRKSAAKKSPVGFVTQQPKFITLTGLIVSALTFAIYTIAFGLVLGAFGVSKEYLATYVATASIIGLAVGFGLQGLVQDVVAGVTLIITDTIDVGDLIEISGQIGRVERVGLRFTHLTNFFNQEVFVPNRMIANIARFPRRGIYAFADVQIPARADREKVNDMVQRIAKGMRRQFGAIILSEPEVSESQTAGEGTWEFLRIQFHLWPGQGALIETTFRERIVDAMKTMDSSYADWMVAVTYRAATGFEQGHGI